MIGADWKKKQDPLPSRAPCEMNVSACGFWSFVSSARICMKRHDHINTHPLNGVILGRDRNTSVFPDCPLRKVSISSAPCEDHFAGPLLLGEKCSAFFWSVGESLPSFLSLSDGPRLKTSARSCRESSVEGGAGGGGSSVYD